jgi:ABC-type Zn uptake system ZnuABC Zn-binding protein ZnuA
MPGTSASWTSAEASASWNRTEPHPHRAEEADPHVWSSPRAFLQLLDTLAPRWETVLPRKLEPSDPHPSARVAGAA